MTRKEAARLAQQEATLVSLGFTSVEADQLRRISMTLRRWYEQECGVDGPSGLASMAIERDKETDVPYMAMYGHNGQRTKYRIADREKGAIKRLVAIVARRNGMALGNSDDWDATHTRPTRTGLAYYIQGDPRGASLYILRPGDVPDGADAGAYYSRGIVVY